VLRHRARRCSTRSSSEAPPRLSVRAGRARRRPASLLQFSRSLGGQKLPPSGLSQTLLLLVLLLPTPQLTWTLFMGLRCCAPTCMRIALFAQGPVLTSPATLSCRSRKISCMLPCPQSPKICSFVYMPGPRARSIASAPNAAMQGCSRIEVGIRAHAARASATWKRQTLKATVEFPFYR
jgi:hypothetical protein